MQVHLTFDYELFFGSEPGTVTKCMIEPTDFLLKLCEQYQIRMTFFVDAGFLKKLIEYSQFPEIQSELELISRQLKRMVALGCQIGLHVHPHWERSTFTDGRWNIVTDGCYKLSDFSNTEAQSIVREYHAVLTTLTGISPKVYRAGGWCIQPFQQISGTLAELGVLTDSTVFPGGKFSSPHYSFDFTKVPRFSDAYRFSMEVDEPVDTGRFLEVPISSWRYNPLFYWKLYALGRINPVGHKMVGDGMFLSQPGRKKSVLTSFTDNHVSADGYYASLLNRQLETYYKRGNQHFVVIGHPKSLTEFSMKKLEQFVRVNKEKNTFTILPEHAV